MKNDRYRKDLKIPLLQVEGNKPKENHNVLVNPACIIVSIRDEQDTLLWAYIHCYLQLKKYSTVCKDVRSCILKQTKPKNLGTYLSEITAIRLSVYQLIRRWLNCSADAAEGEPNEITALIIQKYRNSELFSMAPAETLLGNVKHFPNFMFSIKIDLKPRG